MFAQRLVDLRDRKTLDVLIVVLFTEYLEAGVKKGFFYRTFGVGGIALDESGFFA